MKDTSELQRLLEEWDRIKAEIAEEFKHMSKDEQSECSQSMIFDPEWRAWWFHTLPRNRYREEERVKCVVRWKRAELESIRKWKR